LGGAPGVFEELELSAGWVPSVGDRSLRAGPDLEFELGSKRFGVPCLPDCAAWIAKALAAAGSGTIHAAEVMHTLMPIATVRRNAGICAGTQPRDETDFRKALPTPTMERRNRSDAQGNVKQEFTAVKS